MKQLLLSGFKRLSHFKGPGRSVVCSGCELDIDCNDCEKNVRRLKNDNNIYYPEQQVLNGGVDFKEDEEGGFNEFSMAVLACGSRWIAASCRANLTHKYYIEMNCGKEYCPSCGVKGSKVHKKRIKKTMDRLNHIERFSTCNITIPKEFSEMFLDRVKLDSFYKMGIRVSREFIGLGGFARIHFFGDKKETWLELHPHLNLLVVDSGYLSSEKLIALKESVGRSLRAIIGQDVPVNIHYKFYRKVGDDWVDNMGVRCKGNVLRHQVKYITRATVGYERIKALDFGLRSSLLMLLEGDKDLHKRLILMRWFGNMSNNKYKKTISESLGAGSLDDFGKMLCPCCCSEMTFEVVDSAVVPSKESMEEVSPGVYRVKRVSGMLGKAGEDFKSDLGDKGFFYDKLYKAGIDGVFVK